MAKCYKTYPVEILNLKAIRALIENRIILSALTDSRRLFSNFNTSMNSTIIIRLQVIAFTCCVITTFLMVAATASTEWIKSEDWREGLFEQCVRAGAPMPMPFGGLPIPGCRRAHDAGMSISHMSNFMLNKAWLHELNLNALSKKKRVPTLWQISVLVCI